VFIVPMNFGNKSSVEAAMDAYIEHSFDGLMSDFDNLLTEEPELFIIGGLKVVKRGEFRRLRKNLIRLEKCQEERNMRNSKKKSKAYAIRRIECFRLKMNYHANYTFRAGDGTAYAYKGESSDQNVTPPKVKYECPDCGKFCSKVKSGKLHSHDCTRPKPKKGKAGTKFVPKPGKIYRTCGICGRENCCEVGTRYLRSHKNSSTGAKGCRGIQRDLKTLITKEAAQRSHFERRETKQSSTRKTNLDASRRITRSSSKKQKEKMLDEE